MPLRPPPPAAALTRVPVRRVAGLTLHRVYRAARPSPWWFSPLRAGQPADAGGRFDLPAPHGACYLATSALAATLEAFGTFAGLLPDVELRARRRAAVVVPQTAPRAAALTAAVTRGLGVTAALWAGPDRAMSQAWSAALHRAGWRALFHGIAHDPAGQKRAVTLLDDAGVHAPYGDDAGWTWQVATLHDDPALLAGLARYGVRVVRSDVTLPPISLADYLADYLAGQDAP